MLNIIWDGASILYAYREAILVFLITLFGLGFYSIQRTINHELSGEIKLLAIPGIGSIVLCVSSYVLIWLSHFWPFLLQTGSNAILFFAIFVLIKGLWLGDIKVPKEIQFVVGLMLLLLLLSIRLSFLKHIILPPYSDSPVHYQIVFGLLHPEASAQSKISLDSLLNHYYHFGFHGMAAWLASITHLEPAKTISILGQLFLVIGPLSTSFLVYTLTRDWNGALFAGLLTAIGWSMPAFAVNWGKFPALISLAILPSAIAFPGLYLQDSVRKNKSVLLGYILLIGVVLMHTRILICVFLIMISFFAANKLPFGERLGFFQSIRYSLLYIISLWPLQQFLVDYYYGIPAAVVLFVLLPFAFREFPRVAVTIFLFTFGLWMVVIVPPLLGDGYPALLDRQFLEMIFYLPLSVLGGAGISGMMRVLPVTEVLRWLIMAILSGLVILNFAQHGVVYPDPCCDYFKEDDQLAFQWLRKQVGEHDLVLISAFDNKDQELGTDAGIWLYPLIGQSTNKLPFDTDWTSLAEIEKVCSLGAGQVYIYAGGRIYSFNDAQLAQGSWTEEVFKAGQTVIYRVSQCSK